jgi:excisionase family DNA binding protein
MKSTTEPIWIPLEEAAQLSSIPVSTVYRWAHRGQIKPACGVKMGNQWRFNLAYIQKYGIQIMPKPKKVRK